MLKIFRQIFILIPLFSVCLVSTVRSEENAKPDEGFICPLEASPKELKSLDSFRSVAVLQDGRIKPFDTYAQNILLQFSGKRTFNKKPAIFWLVRLLFAPQKTVDDKIFLINNPEIPMAIGIKPDEKRRYSFREIEGAYEKLNELSQRAAKIEQKSRTIVEEEIIRIDANAQLYSQLSQSFSFAFPHQDFTLSNPHAVAMLELPSGQDQFSFLDIALRADTIRGMMENLDRKSIENFSTEQKDVLQVLNHLYEWSQSYQNLPVLMIPSADPQNENWLSAWDAIRANFTDEGVRQETTDLRDMIGAYWNGQQLGFDMAARSFNDSIRKRSGESAQKELKTFPLELAYNRMALFLWAKLFYAFAFILFLCTLVRDRFNLHRVAVMLIAAGFLCHLTAILMRVNILHRPPVSNLYETFIFVAFMGSLVGLIVESVNKRWLGIVVSSVCGFVFLMIATKFSADGDTLKMLIAVLDSNFWLSTHVLSITTGYAGVCVAGVLGHVYILQGMAQPRDKKLRETTYKSILGVLGFGLTMTFLGTNLGGIWADQSWGRFWGWDPKENGAMLIVLWCAILFHAKVGKLVGPLGIAVGSIVGIIVVMWAWFGVNLLSVGLHSYGFTTGVATSLVIYVVTQILFLLICVPIFKKRTSIG